MGLQVTAAIDRARNALTERIYRSVGGEAGGVAAALVTGKRGYIPEDANDVLRAAGIYHIVSISGLHMVIAAGLVFWLVRAFLAAFPVLALTWPLKKIAAADSMVAAFAYCLFSGAEVATQRSLIMTLAMLGAILAERQALSMHNLAITALIVLVLAPESLISPGFSCSADYPSERIERELAQSHGWNLVHPDGIRNLQIRTGAHYHNRHCRAGNSTVQRLPFSDSNSSRHYR